jgi:hypothetical protein
MLHHPHVDYLVWNGWRARIARDACHRPVWKEASAKSALHDRWYGSGWPGTAKQYYRGQIKIKKN